MFCSNCGKKLEEDVSYCPQCGNKLHNVAEDQGNMIDNRYVWALATVPISISILLDVFLRGSILTMVITIIMNIVFLSLDVKAVQNAGKNAESWLWLGVVLVPLYLFMRASKMDKNYAYGYTWCGIFLASLFL